MTTFIFDLDGTVTSQETLPLIAEHFQVAEQIEALTRETIQGNIPFVESFIKRVHILGKLPVDKVDELLGDVAMHPKIREFIKINAEHCAIATGNLTCWTTSLSRKLDCRFFGSEATVIDNRIDRIKVILKKENVVRHYKDRNEKVVFIGDGNNDVEAMREAHVSIACGLTHYPARSVLTIADYAVFDEEALCRQLNQLF
ncbi:HAD family hydrolase [Pseudothauera nasutitermitis]|uniref:phosphoserine phosphatase n=1 Tax=Pseudothauera nasutitermitis TaxID=2565930 RepID=A0A4S4AVH4_9RHOO|nr:HAD-IB family phosphatase [Pseudothauera nasutitermitis]THF64011.1 HAD family hydrolase [Pseudothauera nasutitermitis]